MSYKELSTLYVRNCIAATNGLGLWSHCKKPVEVVKLVLERVTDIDNPKLNSKKMSGRYAHLLAYFNIKGPNSWDTHKDGLIYTDSKWLKEFRQRLVEMGFSYEAVQEVDYSEAMAQGSSFVELACYNIRYENKLSSKFIAEFIASKQTVRKIKRIG